MMRAAAFLLACVAAAGCGRDAQGPTMTNPASDRLVVVIDTDRSIEMGNGHFQCCDPEQGVQVTLKRIAARPAALSGFVAKDGAIWEIVDVKR
jgi:hypothetical protein